MEITSEQKDILAAILNYNVKVTAVAGSGKTSTALFIGQQCKELGQKMLILTYNSALKEETRIKCEKYELKNIVEAHSFHAFAHKYYGPCHTDKQLKDILKAKEKKDIGSNKYDIIFIDECQDLIPIYYELVTNILQCNPLAHICIVGDPRQMINAYIGAKLDYMEYPSDYFSSKYTWKELSLTLSFRVPMQVSNFINDCYYDNKEIPIRSKKDNGQLNLINIPFKDKTETSNKIADKISEYVVDLIKQGHYLPEDIMVLNVSTKTSNTYGGLILEKLNNHLANNGIPVFVPIIESESPRDKIFMNKKVAFSTISSTKGLERKVIILLNFDNAYFTYFARNDDPNIPPNLFYVAMTRASERLYILSDFENSFNFINWTKFKQELEHFPVSKKVTRFEKRNIRCTELLDHLPFQLLNEIEKKIKITTKRKPNKERFKIPTTSKQGELIEDVSDINGIAVQHIFNQYIETNVFIDIIAESTEIIDQYVLETGYISRKKQIKEINWISNILVQEIISSFIPIISSDIKIKELYMLPWGQKDIKITRFYYGEYIMNVSWLPDIAEKEICPCPIAELKCLSGDITLENCIQAIFYAAMHRKTSPISALVYNVLSHETKLVEVDNVEEVRKIISFLGFRKYYSKDSDNLKLSCMINYDKIAKWRENMKLISPLKRTLKNVLYADLETFSISFDNSRIELRTAENLRNFIRGKDIIVCFYAKKTNIFEKGTKFINIYNHRKQTSVPLVSLHDAHEILYPGSETNDHLQMLLDIVQKWTLNLFKIRKVYKV